MIAFNPKEHQSHLDSLQIDSNIPDDIKTILLEICKTYWDFFANEGVKRTILGFEFGVDAGHHTPICCKKPVYGPHEAPIMMKQLKTLLHNRWAEEIQGSAWGSPIVLAPKPHQEKVTDIDDYIWHMCVSYRDLNRVTKIFAFPILRCDSSIEDMGDHVGILFFISLDAKSEFHQIRVRSIDREKLAFFGPDNKMYTYTVLPFGCVNGPTFYTCMKRNFQCQWTKLFRQRINRQDIDLKQHTSQQPQWTAPVSNVTDDYEQSCTHAIFPNLEIDKQYVLSDDKNVIEEASEDIIDIEGGDPIVRMKMEKSDRVHVTGSRTIIDDIILWSTSRMLFLILYECVCRIFLKHRASFNKDKCEFFAQRLKYVGPDILNDGNTTDRSKYKLVNDWTLPTTGDNLHSFVSFCNFYAKFSPLFQLKMIPLRQLYLQYISKPIPQMAWTPEMISLFQLMKKEMTSSPVLARYDSTKPTFLKTDYSALEMAYIIMQPEDSDEARLATKKPENEGICDFDVNMKGARLKPITFGSRKCSGTESNYHSYVEEIAIGRWAMAENKVYLWGARFYWLCDMKSIHKILEYDGHIHMLCRYSQEMLAYNFNCIHRPSRMHDPLVAAHIFLTHQLQLQDAKMRPEAYSPSYFDKLIQKGVYRIRKTEQHISIDELVKNLSHALMRSNKIYTETRKDINGVDDKPLNVIKFVSDIALKLCNAKREHSEDTNYGARLQKCAKTDENSLEDEDIESNRICFTSVNTTRIAKLENTEKNDHTMIDRVSFYSVRHEERLTYDEADIMNQDGVQDFIWKYKKPGFP